MSTGVESAIYWWIGQRELFELQPMPARLRRVRKMFLGRELHEAISNPRVGDAAMFARLEADLAVFVTSPTIDPKYLKGLSPPEDGCWAIRSVRPRPSIRVLGFFPEKDRFVATNYALRTELGGFESNEWKQAKRKAKTVWRRLFPSYPFMVSRKADELFTGAIDETYFQK